MSFTMLLIWQCLYILRPQEWPLFGMGGDLPVTVIALLVAIVFSLLERKLKYFGIHFVLFVIFTIIVLLSAAVNGWLGGGIARVQPLILGSFLPFILYSNHLVSLRRHEFLAFVLLLFGFIMICNGISQQSSANGIGFAGSQNIANRITFIGVLNDPNDLGGYFILCLPFAGFFAKYGRKAFTRTVSLGFFGLIMYGIYLTNSRGALVSFLVVFMSYVYFRYGLKRSALVGILSLPVLAVYVSLFRSIELEASAVSRTELWYQGLQLFEQNPILGLGMGGFYEATTRSAHNSYILILSELGILGYIVWFNIVAVSVFMLLVPCKYYRGLLQENRFSLTEHTELTRALAFNNAILFSFMGYLTSAFFLSRGYVLFTYMLSSFGFVSYLRITQLRPDLKLQSVRVVLVYATLLAIISIPMMYILVRLLV